MHEHLGIAPGPEPVPPPFQFPPQLPVVVDLPVEDDLDRPVLVADRLVASRKVDDREPPVDQSQARLFKEPFRIRPSMGNPIAHGLEHVAFHWPP